MVGEFPTQAITDLFTQGLERIDFRNNPDLTAPGASLACRRCVLRVVSFNISRRVALVFRATHP